MLYQARFRLRINKLGLIPKALRHRRDAFRRVAKELPLPSHNLLLAIRCALDYFVVVLAIVSVVVAVFDCRPPIERPITPSYLSSGRVGRNGYVQGVQPNE
jgi:hypothetical protein